jgi:hypothetical protein
MHIVVVKLSAGGDVVLSNVLLARRIGASFVPEVA